MIFQGLCVLIPSDSPMQEIAREYTFQDIDVGNQAQRFPFSSLSQADYSDSEGVREFTVFLMSCRLPD
jgi:hypothetical protein